MSAQATADPSARPDGIDVRVEIITPFRAHEMLKQNTFNRNLRVGVVEAYAADILNGNWHFNGDPIRFAKDGTLLDGQHRLHAVISANTPVRMVVMRGLTPQQQHTMDTGIRRTLGDALKLRGEKRYANLAAIVRSIAAYQASLERKPAPSVPTMLGFLDDHSWLRDAIEPLRKVYISTRVPLGVSATLWYRFTLIAADDARVFFDRVGTDEGHYRGEPIYALRRALTTDINGITLTKTLPARQTTGLVIKAWNKYRAGEQCSHRITFIAGGANPDSMPDPQ